MSEKRKNTVDDGIPDVGGAFDYSMLIQNPSGKPALVEFIDIRRMDRDILYRNMVWYGFLHPTWEGIQLPEGRTLSWRQLAECMKADRFPTASTWERVAEVTDMAGDRCPLVRIPLRNLPGHVLTINNPKYKRDSIYQKLQDHILSDYGLILLDQFKESIRKGCVERSQVLRRTDGLKVERASFDNFFFHRTGNPDITQGDIIIHADLTQEIDGIITPFKNVLFRMEVEYNSFDNSIMMKKEIYSSYFGNRSNGRLIGPHLLPVLKNNEDCEREAEDFLRLFSPESLGDEPVAFNPFLAAERLNAHVRRSDLSDRQDKAYGVYYPEGRKGIVIDENGSKYETDLSDNTILYDVGIENDEVRLSDTLTHECVHAYKDRQFYYLQKHFGHQIGCFSYSPRKKYEQDALGQAERQVARLVPRIKMPRRAFTRKARQLLSENQAAGSWNAYERTIEQLAAIFKVSKESARIRMTELGFEQARGVSRFVDGRYIPPFSWTPGSIGNDQTFTISFAEGLEEYGRNPAFRSMLASGAFVYVEAHYCLNDSRYVYRDDTGLHLTAEARRNMDKCCLVFDISYSRKPSVYTHGVFFNEARKSKRTAELDESAKALVASFGSGLNGTEKRRKKLPGTYCDRLLYYRNQKGYSLEKMEELTGISYKTVERYETNPDANKNEAYMVALCRALGLSSTESIDLLDLAGLRLRDKSAHSVYAFVIDLKDDFTVGEINWLLQQNQKKPLTSLIVPVDMSERRRRAG